MRESQMSVSPWTSFSDSEISVSSAKVHTNAPDPEVPPKLIATLTSPASEYRVICRGSESGYTPSVAWGECLASTNAASIDFCVGGTRIWRIFVPQGLLDPGAVGEWIPDGLVEVDVEDRIQLSKEL